MIQLQVLNYLLDTKDVPFISQNELNVEYFSEYPKEYLFIENHLKEYNSIPDKETFIAKFPDFPVIKVNEQADYLLSELQKDKNKRKLAGIFNNVRTLLMNNDIDKAIKLFQDAQNIGNTQTVKCVDLVKDTSRYDEYVAKTQDFNQYYVTTGFKELDDIIGGWDRNEELATIVARTNVGKSWVILKCAVEACKAGLNVGIYSGEMSESKVGYRFDTLLGHISNGALTHGSEKIMIDYKKYIDELPSLVKGSLKVLTPSKINGLAGVNALRNFVERENLDILFVDQRSLLIDDRRARNPVEIASNISMDLKTLQVMKKIPIITVSQQNRTINESGQDTTQIAQSDRIGQDSTIVLFLDRDKSDKTIMKMTLGKSRDSENGVSLSYKVDLNRGEFVYIGSDLEDEQEDTSKSSGDEFDNDGEDVF